MSDSTDSPGWDSEGWVSGGWDDGNRAGDGWGLAPYATPPTATSRNAVAWALGALVVVLLVALAGVVSYLLATDGGGPSAVPAPVTSGAVTPTPTPTSLSPSARPAQSSGCDPDEIAQEAGIDRRNVTVDRCIGEWALAHVYVPAGEPAGDPQYIVSRAGGTWNRYTSIPSAICQQKAIGEGIPAELAELLADCPSSTGSAGSAGDLGLGTPMSKPRCDGRGIVVLYSAVTPGAYAQEISTALAQNPGASYLRTDMACPSLRARDENGNVIYAVYRPSGYSRDDLCGDVRAEGPPAYGRWLDNTSDPTQLVTC